MVAAGVAGSGSDGHFVLRGCVSQLEKWKEEWLLDGPGGGLG